MSQHVDAVDNCGHAVGQNTYTLPMFRLHSVGPMQSCGYDNIALQVQTMHGHGSRALDMWHI